MTLLGRSHELIISGGLNIYPREVEEMLTTFPGIEEAAVVGEPDAVWGEAPVAYLVCSCAIDEGELERYCRGRAPAGVVQAAAAAAVCGGAAAQCDGEDTEAFAGGWALGPVGV